MNRISLLLLFMLISGGNFAHAADDISPTPEDNLTFDQNDPWAVAEVNRFKDRKYSQFKNIFLTLSAVTSLQVSKDVPKLTGTTQSNSADTSSIVSPGIGPGLGILVEIKNRVVRDNSIGPEKKWMSLGMLTQFQLLYEWRASRFQAPLGQTQDLVTYFQKLDWEQIFYYYLPFTSLWQKAPHFLAQSQLLLGLGFNLSTTLDSRAVDQQTQSSFIAAREVDFSIASGFGLHFIYQQNLMLLIFSRFAVNATPSATHPVSGLTLDQRELFSFRLIVAFGVRI